MRLLNCDEMKQVEKYTAKYGLSYQRMMENAGAACTRNIRNIIESEKTRRRNDGRRHNVYRSSCRYRRFRDRRYRRRSQKSRNDNGYFRRP